MRRPNWYDYDSSLQMVREPKGSAEPNMAYLRFLRWTMENRQGTVLDGWLYGPPSGPLVEGKAS